MHGLRRRGQRYARQVPSVGTKPAWGEHSVQGRLWRGHVVRGPRDERFRLNRTTVMAEDLESAVPGGRGNTMHP